MSAITNEEAVLENYIDDLLSPTQTNLSPNSVSTLSIVRPSNKNEHIKAKVVPISTCKNTIEPELTQQKGSPDWAGEKFIAYVCKVNNMSLAIPEFMVQRQFDYSNTLKLVPNSPDWVMGLKMFDNNFIAVVDTGHLLLKQSIRTDASYKKVLVLKDSKWGLAVDEISEGIEVVSSDVYWRKGKNTRPWLCGTDTVHSMAIVNTDKIFEEDK
jgi:chemotaxis signal transduction protein